MCLNQILQDEQRALFRHAQATSAPDRANWQQRLSGFASALQSFPYPHRPFVWRAGKEQDTV
jgi:hypothetical protein